MLEGPDSSAITLLTGSLIICLLFVGINIGGFYLLKKDGASSTVDKEDQTEEVDKEHTTKGMIVGKPKKVTTNFYLEVRVKDTIHQLRVPSNLYNHTKINQEIAVYETTTSNGDETIQIITQNK